MPSTILELVKKDYGFYWLRFRHSNLCVTVEGACGLQTNGTNIHQWECLGWIANHLWRIVPTREPGYFMLENRASAKCLSVQGAGRFQGANISQWECNESFDEFKFRFLAVP